MDLDVGVAGDFVPREGDDPAVGDEGNSERATGAAAEAAGEAVGAGIGPMNGLEAERNALVPVFLAEVFTPLPFDAEDSFRNCFSIELNI